MLNLLLDIIFPKKSPLESVQADDLIAILRTKPKPPRTPATWIEAGFPYQDPDVKKLILHLKKYRDPRVAKALSKRLRDQLAKREAEHYLMSGGGPTLLVPIPLHRSQLQKRGFNQSHLIAKQLSRGHKHRRVFGGLHCVSYSKKQALLTRNQRLRNMIGRFVRNKKKIPDRALVIIVDDITTTGATLHEARLQFANEVPPHRLGAITIAH